MDIIRRIENAEDKPLNIVKNKNYKKRILVTGGCGFIGSNFIRMMVPKYKDYLFVNFDALTYAGNLENLSDVKSHNYEFFKGDIRNINDIEKAFSELGITDVIHLSRDNFNILRKYYWNIKSFKCGERILEKRLFKITLSSHFN